MMAPESRLETQADLLRNVFFGSKTVLREEAGLGGEQIKQDWP